MEEELKSKSELIAKHKKLIEGWQKELKEQLSKHITELERVWGVRFCGLPCSDHEPLGDQMLCYAL